MELARYYGRDVLIIDTAGRLHIDETLWTSWCKSAPRSSPEILLVVDGMTGQDAVNVAKAFNEKLELGGVILTKLDGDTAAARRCPIGPLPESPSSLRASAKSWRYRALPPRSHGPPASWAWRCDDL